jgi:hypothetical protein
MHKQPFILLLGLLLLAAAYALPTVQRQQDVNSQSVKPALPATQGQQNDNDGTVKGSEG